MVVTISGKSDKFRENFFFERTSIKFLERTSKNLDKKMIIFRV